MIYVLLLLGILFQIGRTEDESNTFLTWARQYAQDTGHDPSWVCGLLSVSYYSGLPWWVSPLQGNDWRKLQGYIHEAQAESLELRRATRSDVSQWPINMTLNQEGHGKNFSKHETDAVIKRFPKSFSFKAVHFPVIRNKNHRYKNGYYQIWDERLWLTTSLGRLSQAAPLCWEQHNHSRSFWSATSRFLGWIPSDQCEHTIILQAEDWFATDWSSRPRVRWAAPNGTQWLCGSNLWPWLPPGWIGRCTLGFLWMQGRWTKALYLPANLSVSPHSWTHSEFQHPDGLSSNSTHSVGLRDVVWHIDSLATYLNKVLNHTAKEINLFSFEFHLMRKAALQHQMAIDAFKAAKSDNCTILQNECCVYLPNYKSVTPGLTNFETTPWDYPSKISEWKQLIPVAGIVLTVVVIGPFLVKIVVTIISSILQSVYVQMVLFHVNQVLSSGPPATASGPEHQEEQDLNSFPSSSTLSTKQPE